MYCLLFLLYCMHCNIAFCLTGLVNERGQFSTPHRIHPLDRSPKNLLHVITSAALMAMPNWLLIRPRGGFWENGWNITKFLFIFLFIPVFHELTYMSDPSTDFHAWWLKRHGLVQGCAFWGFRWYCSPFWVVPDQRPKTVWSDVLLKSDVQRVHV